MTERDPGKVRLRDLLRGAIKAVPDTPAVLRGVATLLKVRVGMAGSIGSLLEQQARRYPDQPALAFEDRRWTYAEFNAWANRLAAVLARDVHRGTVVALLMENHPAMLACVAALAKLGAVAGLLNPNLRGEPLRHSLTTMKARRLIVAGECRAQFDEIATHWQGPAPFWLQGHAAEGCPQAWRDLAQLADGASADNPATTAAVETTQPCYYILTSGTTGLPKASVMTHRRWLRGMGALGQLSLRLEPGDTLYCALPLYHNNALTVSWGATLGTGAALALDRKFSATRFWDRIRHYDATAFTYIGELCRYLLAQAPAAGDRDHHVRVCIGNGLRPEIWQAFKERFGIERICEFYAASEGNLAFVNGFGLDATAGFCPFEYQVVACDMESATPRRDAKGRLVKVSRGGVGLLVTEVTDSAPFDGYTDAAASEAKLIRDAFADGDCWFNTGDLVREQGWHHVQFVDRLGDTFRWKGENVATTEVEAAVRQCPGVEDCAVYGVRVPGADGRAGMAAIRLAPGVALDGRAMAAKLAAQLPSYAVPLFIRIVAELETTVTFKTRKQDLKAQGFDPAQVPDPLYALDPREAAYLALTPERYAAIAGGAGRA